MAVPQSFVVIDLETTDLPRPGQTVKITEIAMQSFTRANLLVQKPGNPLSPRVSNKMLFCVNPDKAINAIAAQITGLTNVALSTEKKFDKGLCVLMKHFLERLPQPVCLVAHNGINFDFPILKSELSNIGETLGDGLLALDSLHVFRNMFPKGTRHEDILPFTVNGPPIKKAKTAVVLRTHKLDDVYKFLVTNKSRVDSHSAFGDVTALTECIFAKPESFLMWADAKHLKFDAVNKMW